jgi:hypothetical protein
VSWGKKPGDFQLANFEMFHTFGPERFFRDSDAFNFVDAAYHLFSLFPSNIWHIILERFLANAYIVMWSEQT